MIYTDQLRGSHLENMASGLGKALDAYDFDQAQELVVKMLRKLDEAAKESGKAKKAS